MVLLGKVHLIALSFECNNNYIEGLKIKNYIDYHLSFLNLHVHDFKRLYYLKKTQIYPKRKAVTRVAFIVRRHT